MRGRKLALEKKQTAFLKPIKKESPNEGTETFSEAGIKLICRFYKKRIPEWGGGNHLLSPFLNIGNFSYKKESPNEGTETAASGSLNLTFSPL